MAVEPNYGIVTATCPAVCNSVPLAGDFCVCYVFVFGTSMKTDMNYIGSYELPNDILSTTLLSVYAGFAAAYSKAMSTCEYIC